MASSLTSDQVNYLIWRYLQESGFRDSAFQFQVESKVDKGRDVFGPGIRAGSLIYLIQRGLQYIECAALVNKDGGLRKKSAEPFCFFPAIVSAVDVEDEGVGEENGHAPEDDDDPMEGSNSSTSTAQTTSSRKHGRDDVTNGNGVTGHKRRKKGLPGPDGDTPMTDGFPETPVPVEELRVTKGYSVGTQVEDVIELTAADSILLGQDDKSVLTCAWNPVHSTVLATASPDSIARIWNVPLDATPSEIRNKIIPHEPLIQSNTASHYISKSKQGDVTALRWSPQGDLLATGSYDGQTRIWTTDGLLRFSHSLHSAPVTSLKWNKSANTLLSLSCDGKIIAWDAHTGDLRRSYELVEDEAASDMDWVEDNQFIACGSKGGIFKYDLENEGPVSTYLGHQKEVNCLTWDEVSDRLATGGEDSNVLIWHKPTTNTTYECKLTGHTSSIVSLSWQPTTVSSPRTQRILASASNDRTIRIWDTLSRTVLHELKRHFDPIESISFSPDGLRLASSANGRVIVWRADTGAVTHVYDGMKGRRKNGKVTVGEEGEISGISWDEGGVRVAVGGGELKCSVIRLNTKPLV